MGSAATAWESAQPLGGSNIAARPSYGKEQVMRVGRKAEAAKRVAVAGVSDAQLAQVKGGLKAERVQGSDPSGPGGD
jgi:hypothetical protein